MSDVRDILELELPDAPEISKHTIMGTKQSGPIFKKKKEKDPMKRPEGMHRELYALLYSSDGNKELPPLLPTDSDKGYKSNKVKLGMKKVRPWREVEFSNPARTDGARFKHWRKVGDEGKEYPFALFNKKTKILKYEDEEYNKHFKNSTWKKPETDVLFELCEKFDLRWTVIHDRWPENHPKKSIEDMKERYYEVTNCLKKARNLTGPEGKLVHYDAEHEKKRKEQLRKLLERTRDQYEEEQRLLAELRKIEARKKEREKKTADLQKLISANDPSSDSKKIKAIKKKTTIPKAKGADPASNLNIENCSGIKFPDLKTFGVSLRSQKMKLPINVGQKKAKAIEQLLSSIGIELNPVPTEENAKLFNDLRSDLVLMFELKNLITNYAFEMQTLKHQYETLNPGKTLEIPESFSRTPEDSPVKQKGISEVIDYIIASPSTPNRKRKAALEQSNILKKIKQRT